MPAPVKRYSWLTGNNVLYTGLLPVAVFYKRVNRFCCISAQVVHGAINFRGSGCQRRKSQEAKIRFGALGLSFCHWQCWSVFIRVYTASSGKKAMLESFVIVQGHGHRNWHQWKPMCDFISVLKINIMHIVYRLRDITIYGSKMCVSSHRFYQRYQKTRIPVLPDGRNLMIIGFVTFRFLTLHCSTIIG